MDRDDGDLILALQKGSRGAFEELFARHRSPLMRYIRTILSDSPAAEDVLQETFLLVWEKAGQLKDPEAFKTWLRRIAANTSLNYLRRGKRKKMVSLTAAEPDEEEAEEWETPSWMIDCTSLSPEELYDRKERITSVRRLIDRLPPEKREVIRLIHQEGLSIGEASRILGVPEGTVKSRLHYSVRKMARENAGKDK
jgi:RNA polymerase sigma-70 factor (ECF subfamily)